MFENMHHKNRQHQSQEISDKRSPKIRSASASALAVIISQQQRDEYTRNYDIAQTQHGAIVGSQSFLQEILRKHQFNRRFNVLRNRHHDVGFEHPENVVKEQPRQQHRAGSETAQMNQFDAVQRKRQSKQIVRQPVLQKRKDFFFKSQLQAGGSGRQGERKVQPLGPKGTTL